MITPRVFISLILAFLIPLIVILTLFFVYVFDIEIKDITYNYVYVTEDVNTFKSNKYRIFVDNDNNIAREEIEYCKDSKSSCIEREFYLHDTKNNTSTKVTFESLQSETVIDGSTSPDGYTFDLYFRPGLLFSDFNDNEPALLHKGSITEQNLIQKDGITLIGWIKQ